MQERQSTYVVSLSKWDTHNQKPQSKQIIQPPRDLSIPKFSQNAPSQWTCDLSGWKIEKRKINSTSIGGRVKPIWRIILQTPSGRTSEKYEGRISDMRGRPITTVLWGFLNESLCCDSAFAHKKEFYIFKFPKRFLEISWREISQFQSQLLCQS